MFITFEGGEGSGKSTVINKLYDYLSNLGYDVIYTREPGGSKFAEEIRSLIFNYDTDPLTEMLLFAAARRDHINSIIKPALNENKIVLCDRFIDSSLVYQGMLSSSQDIYNEVEEINKLVIDSNDLIDLTILLDIDPHIGLNRIKLNNRETNSYDNRDIDFHKKVRKGYLNLSNKYKRINIIDANQSKDVIFNECINIIEQKLDGLK